MNTSGKHVWGIELRYVWISFLEIGTDKDHVHFLIQSVPSKSSQEIIRVVKSITAKRVFVEHPEGKKKLWGRRVLERWIFCNKCSKNTNEAVIQKYVKQQGTQDEYKQLYMKV